MNYSPVHANHAPSAPFVVSSQCRLWHWRRSRSQPHRRCRSPAPQVPQVVAITGGKLLTVSHGTIENGTLVLAGRQDRRHRKPAR